MIQTLQYYGVDYIMLRRDQQLGEQMKHRPDSFTAVDIPGDRYVLYVVDLSHLESDALIPANDQLAAKKFDAATNSYKQTLEQAQETGDEDTLALSYLGLGQSYTEQKLPDKAVSYFEQLVALDPEDEAAYILLAEARQAAGDQDEARAALGQAVELAPQNVELRSKLAEFAIQAGDKEAAVEQYQTLIQMFPEVPSYRVKLGGALLLAGDDEAANKQFEEATDLGPLSEANYADMGDALQNAGRLKSAAAKYERAVELIPQNQLYNLKLGTTYSKLSIAEGKNEEYFGKAEETLKRTARLETVPGLPDYKSAALLALGDLYYQWNRKEEAIAVYEQILKLDPNAQQAKDRLEELQS
jgi:tetratricopeptide (TPR) repeat protein